MSQLTPKHMLDKKKLKLEKIFNSFEINPISTYPLSEPSVHCIHIFQGLPWCVAATVLCLGHVDSLKMETEASAPGEKPTFLGVRYY